MLMTPWALATFGAATADAVAVAAATLRKLRRVGRTGFDDFVMAFLSLGSVAALAPAGCYQHYVFIGHYGPASGNSIAATRITKDCIFVVAGHAICPSLPPPGAGRNSASVLRRARRITLPNPPRPGNV